MNLAPASGPLLLPRHRPRVLEAFQVPSESTGRVYTVRRLADGTWDCDCPDWLYRKGPVGEDCKHILGER